MNDNKVREMVKLMASISKNINRKVCQNKDPRQLNLTALMILNQLDVGNPKMLTEISESLGIPNSTASVIIDKLVKKGLVKRERDDKDRRKVMIYMTQKAAEQEKEMISNHIFYFKQMLSLASDEDVEAIIKGLNILDKLVDGCTIVKEEMQNETKTENKIK